MKRVLKPILATSIILAALTAGTFYFLTKGGGSSNAFENRITKEQSDQSADRAYRYDMDENSVELKNSGDGKNVLNFDENGSYSVDASKKVSERLGRLIKRLDADFQHPIIAVDPYGTNPGSFYFYFKLSTKGMIRYTVTVKDESVPDLVRYVDNGQEDNLGEVQEFTVSGLVPGQTNYIVMQVLDSQGAEREKIVYKYTMPASKAPSKIRAGKGHSRDESENGLYAVFPSGDKNIYLYDNQGILRNTTRTESEHGRRLYQSGDQVLYQIAPTRIARVGATGKVTGVAQVSKTKKIKDFSYDGYDHVYSLVTVKGRDRIFSTSFQSGQTTLVYAFPKGVKIASLSEPKAGSMYLTGDSPSGLLKLDAIAGVKPVLTNLYGSKKAWKKYGLKKKVWEDGTASRWGTTGSVLALNETKDGYTLFVEQAGRKTAVAVNTDEKNKKVKVKANFPIGIKGNCLCIQRGSHYIMADTAAGNFAEYDIKGRTTMEYGYGGAIDGIAKVTLDGMCFYKAQ